MTAGRAEKNKGRLYPLFSNIQEVVIRKRGILDFMFGTVE